MPLIRNLNSAIIYIYVYEKLSYLGQRYPRLKDKYIGPNHPCV